MKSKTFAFGLMLVFVNSVGFAAQAPEQNAGEVTVKSGTTSVIRRWWNCKGDLPPISSAAAERGTLVLHMGEGNHCGKPNQPVLELVYTPQTGFKGRDSGFFYYTRWQYRISITVN